MSYCYQCGTRLPENARFCPVCGSAQPAAPQGAQTPQAPARETVRQTETQAPVAPVPPRKKKHKALIVVAVVLGVPVALIAGVVIYLFLGFPLKIGDVTIEVTKPLFGGTSQIMDTVGMDSFSFGEMTMLVPEGMTDVTEEFGEVLDQDFIMRKEDFTISIMGKRYDRAVYEGETAENLIQAMYKYRSNSSLENVEILPLEGKPYYCLRAEETNFEWKRVYHYSLALDSEDAVWEIDINSFGADYPDWVKIADSIQFD